LNEAGVFFMYHNAIPTVRTTLPRIGELLGDAVHLQFQKYHQFPVLKEFCGTIMYYYAIPTVKI
jgi:hypothetical protein